MSVRAVNVVLDGDSADRSKDSAIPEHYTLVEIQQYAKQTMPTVMDRRPVRLHAAVHGEDDGITAACSNAVMVVQDVPKSELPFSAGWKTAV